MEEAKLYELKNGMKVLVQEQKNFESVTLGFWVKAGGVTEEKEKHGISHFLEHMVFKGTKKRTAKQIAEEIENVGGYLNAYTSRNVTAFHSKVLKEDVDLAVDVLSDMFINPTFPEEELERERGVILQEIGQTIDDPNDIIFDHFQNIAFPNQPMGRPILGTAEIISKISSADLRNYHDAFYNSSSTIFSIAGNCEAKKVIDLIEKYTSEIDTNVSCKKDIIPLYEGGYFSDFRPKLEQAHVILGFEGVKYTDENYYTASLFSSILGEGMSSRLFQEIREKRGLVYSIYSFNSCYRETGLFGVYAATGPDKVEDLLNVTYDEICKMKNSITKKEFNRTKAQFKSSILMGRENTASLCEQNASQTILFGEPLNMNKVLEKVNSISIDEVADYTDKILVSRPTLITVGNVNCENWFKSKTC